MKRSELQDKAEKYLNYLCELKPNRRTGSAGNRQATEFFARTIEGCGYKTDTTVFDCLDYTTGEVSFSCGDNTFEVFISPYSLGCDVKSGIVTVTNMTELEQCDCKGKILLLKGEICAEQLMPKNFVFYNPEHHKKIYSLLEQKQPAAIISATSKNPDLVGALYPYPLINDGDFAIPNVYCSDVVGEEIAALTAADKTDPEFRLIIEAKRIPAKASNVVGLKHPAADKKLVLTAHIDAYEDSPGASDNASGVIVLLLLAELLADYSGPLRIEIVAINGEDHYSAAGEMNYLMHLRYS